MERAAAHKSERTDHSLIHAFFFFTVHFCCCTIAGTGLYLSGPASGYHGNNDGNKYRRSLKTTMEKRGLTSSEAKEKLKEFGYNKLKEEWNLPEWTGKRLEEWVDLAKDAADKCGV